MNNDPNMPTSKLRDKTSHHLYTNPVKYAETGHVIQASNLKRRVSRKLPALRDQDPGKYPGLVFEPAAQLSQIWGPATTPNLFCPITTYRRSCRGFESAFYRAGNAYLTARKHVSSNRGRCGDYVDVNARRQPDAGNFAALMPANELRERVSAIAGKQQGGKLGLVSGVEGRAAV
jgi:hypothetical protein